MNFDVIIRIILFTFIIQLIVLGQSEDRRSYIIAVDIGHSWNRPGAISSRGKYEYDFNQIFANALLTRLKKEGYKKSYIIQPLGNDINERVSLVAKNRADILISIHHDSVQPEYLKKWIWGGDTLKYCDSYSGYSVFVSSKNNKFKNSVLFATKIGEELIGCTTNCP